jgi:Cytochrome c oxidase subunit III
MVWIFIQLFIGTLALLVSLIRIVLNHFTNKHHVGFESAIWYWHFVDGASIKHVIYRYFIEVKSLLLQLKGRVWYFDYTFESTFRAVFSFRSQLFYQRKRLLQGILVRFTSIGKRAKDACEIGQLSLRWIMTLVLLRIFLLCFYCHKG